MSVATVLVEPQFWKDRARAAGIHLQICLLIAGLAALLVFGLWYPYPYGEIAGGRELFMLVVTVDVVLGPTITFAIFDRRKGIPMLRRDLTIIGLIQLAALAYGLWTVSLARPVHLVFEIDRFRVVHAVDVPANLLNKTPTGINPMPLMGPDLLAVRPFQSEAEKFDATMLALGGVQLSYRPDLWQAYGSATDRVKQAARPLDDLKRRFPARAAEIDAAIHATGRLIDSLTYLPMVGRKSFWTVVLDAQSAQVLTFIPLDPY